MSRLAAALFVVLALLLPQTAFAWNATGHQIVGSIADQLLTANAARQVKNVLGVSLREAGPWLDCVKSVRRQADGTLAYSPAKEDYDKPCKAFTNDHSAMIDYVGRNWANCVYPEVPNTSANTGCHNTYHFDDVAVQRDRFDRNYAGTNDHDLIAAINAAIAVMMDRPAPPPFDIKNKREALFMLAHLVGDLGQPLHVAAPYLGPDGGLVDPDVTHTIDPGTETAGGNWIMDGQDNFHYEWDDNPKDLAAGTAPQALVDAAKALPPQTGAIEDWSYVWATDTIAVAKKITAKVTYVQTGPRLWTITFQDGHDAYFQQADQTKKDQYVKCGGRLAAILNKIWP